MQIRITNHFFEDKTVTCFSKFLASHGSPTPEKKFQKGTWKV
jgi:hypothetical protein